MDMDQSTKHKTSKDTHAPHILTADAELGTKGTDRRRLTFRLVSPPERRRAECYRFRAPRTNTRAYPSSQSCGPRIKRIGGAAQPGEFTEKNKEKFMNVGSKTISREKGEGGQPFRSPAERLNREAADQ